VAGRRPGTRRRASGKRDTDVAAQLTLSDWEETRAQEATSEARATPHSHSRPAAEDLHALDRLAEALAPRLAAELSTRLHAPTDEAAPTARLLTLDQLVAELPHGKRPETWKRWLYERTRRGDIPGCVKLGGMLFFEREPALTWIRAGAAVPS
jgi:hypothetical protein